MQMPGGGRWNQGRFQLQAPARQEPERNVPPLPGQPGHRCSALRPHSQFREICRSQSTLLWSRNHSRQWARQDCVASWHEPVKPKLSKIVGEHPVEKIAASGYETFRPIRSVRIPHRAHLDARLWLTILIGDVRPVITPPRGSAKSTRSRVWPSTRSSSRPAWNGRVCPCSSVTYPSRETVMW